MAITVSEEELKAKHPAATGFRTLRTLVDGEMVEGVIKLPLPEAAYTMFREKTFETSAAEKASANRILFNAAVVWPEGPELRDLVKAHAAIVDTWAGEIAELAGAIRGTVVGKL